MSRHYFEDSGNLNLISQLSHLHLLYKAYIEDRGGEEDGQGQKLLAGEEYCGFFIPSPMDVPFS